ncbi:MAG TPA: glycosyltransferase 87 family protein [Gaiellaceae bacterium]|nr:glycosyltransferase 87 family protein [Gaiellaceae bacterium]
MRSSSERATSPGSSATSPRRSRVSTAVDRWAGTRWGGLGTALVTLLAGAAVLRLVGIEYGLPYGNLLNPDEQSIVPRAWKLVHGGGGDPHWFDYPTLLMYLNAPFQLWQGEPSYLTARIVEVVLALAAIAAAWWLGRRAFRSPAAGVVAAAVVAVCTIHVAYSRAAVTDVPLTLAVAVALALMVSGRLELAGVAAGVATGFKYPGIFLLVPLVVAGWKQWPRLALAGVLAAAAFLASSPFLVVHAHQAWHDAFRVQRLARDGWLGFEHDHVAAVAFVDRLWEGLGPALIVCAIGLVAALVRRSRTDLILVSFVAVYFADLLTLDAHFDRYVLPLVPALGALAGRMRALAPVTLLLLIVPLTWSVRDAKELTKTDTRVVAHRWIEQHIPRGTRVAADPSTPPFATLRVLPLQLPGPGRSFDSDRNLSRLRKLGVEDVVVTGSVTDRVLAARDHYPREARFYDELRQRAERVYFVQPGPELAGPWVAVYRLR